MKKPGCQVARSARTLRRLSLFSVAFALRRHAGRRRFGSLRCALFGIALPQWCPSCVLVLFASTIPSTTTLADF
jgi:hypothetical protein